MKAEDIIDRIITHDDSPDFVDKTKECFQIEGLEFSSPYFTKVKHLYSGAAGKHTGLYFIFQKIPEGYIYYYTGIATKGNTVNKYGEREFRVTNISQLEHTAKIKIDYKITDSAFESSDFIIINI